MGEAPHRAADPLEDALEVAAAAFRIIDRVDDTPGGVADETRRDDVEHHVAAGRTDHFTEGATQIGGLAPTSQRGLRGENPDRRVQQCLGHEADTGEQDNPGCHVLDRHFDRWRLESADIWLPHRSKLSHLGAPAR